MRPSHLVWLPLALFVGLDLVLAAAALVAPSFALVRLAYDANTIAMPVVLAGAVVLWRRSGDASTWGRRLAWANGMVALVAVGARVYATHIEPRRLVVREETLAAPLAVPLRIVHLSDIQSDAIGKHEEQVFAKIRELDPDLVIHSGDLLQPLAPATIASELPKIAALVASTQPRLGFVTVIGDTDGWMGSREHVAGMRLLHSSSLDIEHGDGRIRILGLSLEQSSEGARARPPVERWLADARPRDFHIVVGHRPDFVLGIMDLSVLALAGHTHGGQIRLPFVGPLVTLSAVPRDWARGFRRAGSAWLDVSAGIGAEHAAGLPSIRLNCPPELSLLSLAAAREGSPDREGR